MCNTRVRKIPTGAAKQCCLIRDTKIVSGVLLLVQSYVCMHVGNVCWLVVLNQNGSVWNGYRWRLLHRGHFRCGAKMARTGNWPAWHKRQINVHHQPILHNVPVGGDCMSVVGCMQSIVGLILLSLELVQHMHFINLRIKNLKFNRLDLWTLSEQDTLEAREISYYPSCKSQGN